VLRYKRADGVDLTATLYTPPGYDPARDGRLPTLLWAYPREFKSKEAAGQNRRSPHQFSAIGPQSPVRCAGGRGGRGGEVLWCRVLSPLNAAGLVSCVLKMGPVSFNNPRPL
jgi:hypothetical protein